MPILAINGEKDLGGPLRGHLEIVIDAGPAAEIRERDAVATGERSVVRHDTHAPVGSNSCSSWSTFPKPRSFHSKRVPSPIGSGVS